MSLFSLRPFSGVAPRVSPRLLGPTQAQVAQNCKLWSGEIRPWSGLGTPTTLPKVGPLKTVFLYAGAYWFHWTQEVDIVMSALVNNNNNRCYFTGDGDPKMTDDTIALAGGTQYPMNSTLLGIPNPTLAPTHNNPTATDPNNKESRVYTWTWVRRWNGIDEETGPSPASAIATVTPGQSITITTTTAPPSGSYTPTGATWLKRLYRSNTGASGTVFQYLTEIAAATPTFNDTLLGYQLGAKLATDGWAPPPSDLKGLVMIPNGIAVGFRGYEVCPSVAYQPHAFPVAYRQTSTWPVVALGVTGQSVVVATTGQPYILTGVDPASMSMDRIDLNQACASKRSMVDMGEYVIYASPDGLVAIGPGIARIITENFFTVDEWRALNPASIHAYHYDSRYYGFYNNGTPGGFIFDPAAASFTFLSVYYDTGYNDLLTDKLYVVSGQSLTQWDANAAAPLTFKWRSGILTSPTPTCPGVAQIIGKQSALSPTTFRLYADGVLFSQDSVIDEYPFRLPEPSDLYVDFEIEVEGTKDVEQILIASNMLDIKRG